MTEAVPAWEQRLARLARSRCSDVEPAHDWLHVMRVVQNAHRIASAEGAQVPVARVAALLHELFNYPKGHPESHRSGEVCAQHARAALQAEGCDPEMTQSVCYAIEVHPFSRGIVPVTLEAKILQDADRLDAIGAIGIARCFASCADMKRPFYSTHDAFCRGRVADDKSFGIDHFYRKLLTLPGQMHTETARALAAERLKMMQQFLSQLEREVTDQIDGVPVYEEA